MAGRITRRELMKAGVATAAVGVAGMVPGKSWADRKKLNWRMQTHWPTGVRYYKTVYEPFAERVKEASNGEINITPMPPGSIVPTGEVLTAIGRGVFQVALLWPAYWIGKLPVAGHLNGQLFTWDSFEEMWFFMKEMGALNIIREAYAEQGVQVVGPISAGPLALYSKKPLVKPDDFRGFKVRSTGIPAAVFQKIGATPVFFPGEELYQALQTGVCDGAHWGGVVAGWEMKFQEVTNNIITPFLAQQTLGEIIINKKVWDALPADHKRILEDCCLAANADSNAWFSYNDYQCMQEFKSKYKGSIVKMDPETVTLLRKYSIEVIDDYSQKDPKYCGRVGQLMHEFLKMTGKI